MGLRGVLSEQERVTLAEVRERSEVDRLSVQVDWGDCGGTRRDRGLDCLNRQEGGVGIRIHQHGRGPSLDDRLDGRDERHGRRDDLVAGADARGAEPDRQRVGAARGADAVQSTTVAGELALEGSDLGAANESAVLHHAVDRSLDLACEGRMLCLQVK